MPTSSGGHGHDESNDAPPPKWGNIKQYGDDVESLADQQRGAWTRTSTTDVRIDTARRCDRTSVNRYFNPIACARLSEAEDHADGLRLCLSGLVRKFVNVSTPHAAAKSRLVSRRFI